MNKRCVVAVIIEKFLADKGNDIIEKSVLAQEVDTMSSMLY